MINKFLNGFKIVKNNYMYWNNLIISDDTKYGPKIINGCRKYFFYQLSK